VVSDEAIGVPSSNRAPTTAADVATLWARRMSPLLS
jgi:hypothetical protein